jgi:hypothetical protein
MQAITVADILQTIGLPKLWGCYANLLLIFQSFDWLEAFHLDMLQANIFIAV